MGRRDLFTTWTRNIPRTQVNKTVKDTLKNVLTLAENAAHGFPIPSAKGSIEAVLRIIRVFEEATENSEPRKALEEQLKRLLEVLLEPLTGDNLDQIPSDLVRRIEVLALELNDLTVRWRPVAAHSGIRRWVGRESEVAALSDISRRIKNGLDIFGLKGDLVREMIAIQTSRIVEKIALTTEETQNELIENTEAVKEIAAVTEKIHVEIVSNTRIVEDVSSTNRVIITQGQLIHDLILSREEREVLRSLPIVNTVYNSNSVNARVRCFEGTREAIIKDILEWLENTGVNATQVFWLNGIAGIGKSTLARTVAERAENQKLLGASYFFSRPDGLTDPSSFFTTIAYQLAKVHPSFKTAIISAVRQDPDVAHAALGIQVQKLLVTPLRNITGAPCPVLIVVDALDECTERDVEYLLKHLLSNIRDLPFIKLLITGRPEHRLTSILHRKEDISRIFMHDIEKSIVQADIILYLRFRFEETSEKFPSFGAFWVDEDVVLVAGLTGLLFIYAVTAMNTIQDPRVGNPKKQLRRLLKGKSLENSSTSPSLPFRELDRLYNQVVGDVILPGDEDELAPRFRSVVGTLVAWMEPLSLCSLEHLLGLEEGEAMAALLFLPSVVHVPTSSNDIPRIYHPSFPDFITDPKRCTHSHLVIHTTTHHREISIRCFHVMSVGLKRDICDISDASLLNKEVEDLDSKLAHAVPPWLRYACLHWAAHLALAPPGDQELMEKLDTFCSSYLLYWIEVLSLLSLLPNVLPIIRQARDWAIKSECDQWTQDLLNDTLRMIPAHYDVISSCALHLYYSVLPFIPLNCTMAEAYEHELEGAIEVIQSRDLEWGRCISTLQGHEEEVTSVACSTNGAFIVSGSNDKTVRMWDAETGRQLLKLEGHKSYVSSVAFSTDCSLIVSGSGDRTARVWDTESGREVLKLKGHTHDVVSVAFSATSSSIVSGSRDSTVRVWDAKTGYPLLVLEDHSDEVNSIAISPDDNLIVSGSNDQTACIWDAKTGRQLLSFQGHTREVNSVSFSPNGSLVISGSTDRSARVWDPKTGDQLLKLGGHSTNILSATFSLDSSLIISSSYDNTARMWDANSGEEILKLEGHSDAVRSVSFSPNSLLAITGSDDKTVCIWDISGDPTSMEMEMEGHNKPVTSIAFSSSNSRVVSGSEDYTARVWDAETGHQLLKLQGHSRDVTSVSFLPNDLSIVSGSSDHTVRVWDAETGIQQFKLQGHTDLITSIACSQNSMLVASGSWDTTVRVWDVETGRQLLKLEGHAEWVNAVTFSPSSSLVISGSQDRTVRVWDSMNGSQLFKLEGSSEAVRSVSMSPNDLYILSGSWDRTARVWDAATGECMEVSKRYNSLVERVWFSDGGYDACLTLENGETHIWNPSLPFQPSTPLSDSLSQQARFTPPSFSMIKHQVKTFCDDDDECSTLCWLPPAIIPSVSAYTGQTLAVGTGSGRFILLKTPSLR